MSDFDTVLERLLSDSGFRTVLAADPAAALRGYQLTADEIELLHAQVDTGSGGNSQVEERTSKASLFGLISPLMGAAGMTGGTAHHMPTDGSVGGTISSSTEYSYSSTSSESWYLSDGVASGAGHGGLGEAAQAGVDGLGGVGQGGVGQGGIGQGGVGQGGVGQGGIGGPLAEPGIRGLAGHNLDVPQSGGGSLGTAPPPPPGYHPHIDVNGDGHWDGYTVQGRTDGGVDLVADMNHDGRADFIGHDYDRDGLVDAADYDEDRNGTFETHMRDVNGDGWLDTRTVDPEPPADGTGRHGAGG
jgi:hypothetical protein